MDRRDIDNLWLSFEPVSGVAFCLNYTVRIKVGEQAGETGGVISVETPEPTPTYIVELGSGSVQHLLIGYVAAARVNALPVRMKLERD